MLFPLPKLSLPLLLLPLLLLSACSKQVDPRAAQGKANTPFRMPADAYLALAKNQPEKEQQAMLIMAAGRHLYDGQLLDAKALLSQTNPVTVSMHDEKTILLAKIYSLQHQAETAIATLSEVKEQLGLSPFYRTQYHDILADAYAEVHKITESIVERVRLEHLLTDEDSRATNRRKLWSSLINMPSSELQTLAIESTEGSELQGWLKLALIPQEQSQDGEALFSQLEAWQRQFPGHPGVALLPSSLDSLKAMRQASPQNIAILLPLSGPLAGPGQAVKDGFMAAYQTHNPEQSQQLQFYDTATEDAAVLYQKALDKGAEYIVGPLTKAEVAKVALLEHPVPTVFLNDTREPGQNTYNFGLSPANEAKQVAQKALESGLRNTLIIAPVGQWGDDIVAAFSTHWEAQGGKIVEKLSYDNQSELNPLIRSFLHVSEHDAKEKQYRETDKANYQPMESKRRQDFDMIFLLAYPSKARQIMPLLKYYFAGNIPVFATSSIYSGSINKREDKDLEGIIFCDMPWIFTHQMDNKNWPETFNSYARLYALGMDSYSLSLQLNQLQLFPAMNIHHHSGDLYLNRNKDITRIMAFGQFKNGLAEALFTTS